MSSFGVTPSHASLCNEEDNRNPKSPEYQVSHCKVWRRRGRKISYLVWQSLFNMMVQGAYFLQHKESKESFGCYWKLSALADRPLPFLQMVTITWYSTSLRVAVAVYTPPCRRILISSLETVPVQIQEEERQRHYIGSLCKRMKLTKF